MVGGEDLATDQGCISGVQVAGAKTKHRLAVTNGITQGVGAEEDPSEGDDDKGNRHRNRRQQFAIERILAHRALKGEHTAMNGAPDHKVQDEPCHKPPSNITIARLIGAAFAFAVTAKGNVQVIAQPGRQRQVPAAKIP